MSTMAQLEADFDKLSEQINKAMALIGSLRCQRQELREALQALYDAIPTGFGEDRALNEATKQAEKVLGISR